MLGSTLVHSASAWPLPAKQASARPGPLNLLLPSAAPPGWVLPQLHNVYGEHVDMKHTILRRSGTCKSTPATSILEASNAPRMHGTCSRACIAVCDFAVYHVVTVRECLPVHVQRTVQPAIHSIHCNATTVPVNRISISSSIIRLRA